MSFFLDDPAEHPDAITLEIAGQEIPWLLNKSALESAADEGIDISEYEEMDEGDVMGNLDALAAVLYMGTIPFREHGREMPTLEDFDDVLTPRVAQQVGPQVMAQYEGLDDEQIKEVMGEAGKE